MGIDRGGMKLDRVNEKEEGMPRDKEGRRIIGCSETFLFQFPSQSQEKWPLLPLAVEVEVEVLVPALAFSYSVILHHSLLG